MKASHHITAAGNQVPCFAPAADAFLKRYEWTAEMDSSYPFGEGYALALYLSHSSNLYRYAWWDGTSVFMTSFSPGDTDPFLLYRLNYLSGKLGMEHDAFRLRRNKLYVGIANPMPLKRGQPIEWRPGMTSIDQLLAYRMMVQG